MIVIVKLPEKQIELKLTSAPSALGRGRVMSFGDALYIESDTDENGMLVTVDRLNLGQEGPGKASDAAELRALSYVALSIVAVSACLVLAL